MTETISLFYRLNRFRRDNRAVAAIEFALILPFMLALYLGGIEVTKLLGIDRKTAQASRTIADLVAQKSKDDPQKSNCHNSSSKPSNIQVMFDAADEVMTPYSANPNMATTVSCLEIDKNGGIKLIWSESRRGSPRNTTAGTNLPAGLNDTSATTYWVLGEATYVHPVNIPLVRDILNKPSFDLSKQVYMIAR